MSNIETLIQEFVVNLRRAIAQEAAQAFAVAGGGGESHQPNPRGKPGPRPKGVISSVAKPAKKAKGGGKRTTEEIEAQGKTIVAHLKKTPAQGAEQLGVALGLGTAELALPIIKLIESKQIKFTGQKRGRKYSVK
jgi:hypothetical protein